MDLEAAYPTIGAVYRQTIILTSGIYVWQLISTVYDYTMPYLIWEKQTKINDDVVEKAMSHNPIDGIILDVIDISQKIFERHIFKLHKTSGLT